MAAVHEFQTIALDRETLLALIYEKSTPEPMSGCWLWDGRPNAQGYGRVSIGRRRVVLAHRLSYLLHVGELPDDICVLHRCDVRICVNPRDLFRGDRGDNARDMAAKGRQAVQRDPSKRPVCRPEQKARGEAHPNARVTADAVLEIRLRFAGGESKASLVRAFGIGFCGITGIVTGLTWAHVGGPIQEGAK